MPFFSRSSSSNPARRRDDGDELRALSFDAESFEFVPAGEAVGLLRLSGRWIAAVDRVLHDVTLVAAVGADSVDVLPLPDLEGSAPLATPAGTPWRAAFSVSSELALNEATQFALAVEGGERLDLPGLGDLPEPVLDEPSAPVLDELPPPLSGQAEPPAEAPAGFEARSDPGDDEVARLTAELSHVRRDLEVERRRHESLEEEIRSHAVLENDLRSAMAMQEAELAAAATHASQRAKRAERQRDRATSVEAGERQRRPVDADLVERLQRARRAADAAA